MARLSHVSYFFGLLASKIDLAMWPGFHLSSDKAPPALVRCFHFLSS